MNLEAFFVEDARAEWGSEVEQEVRHRIRLSVAAYSYEFEDESIMTDGEFDEMCLSIRPRMNTGNERMDRFFRNHFDPSTGQWIRKHPEIERIKQIYEKHYKR